VLRLDPVVSDLLAFGHAVLRPDAVIPDLLALNHTVLDSLGASWPLSHALSPGRPRLPLDTRSAGLSLNRREALLALHPRGRSAATAALDVERWARRLTTFGRLGAVLGRRLRGSLLTVVIVAARSGGGRH